MNDLISKYLDGEMTVREQLRFEELLRTDSALRQEFMLQKRVEDALAEDDVMSLRNNLEQIMKPGFSKRKLRPVIYSAFVAVIVLFIVVGVKFLIPHQEPNGEQLFDSYYEKYPSSLNVRSGAEASSKESLTHKAFDCYEQQQLSKAKKYFTELLRDDKSNHRAMFYLAITNIELGDFIHAEKYLQRLVNHSNHIFWEQSNWYLALLYLKQQKYDKAKLSLRTIVDERLSYTSKAEELLKQID